MQSGTLSTQDIIDAFLAFGRDNGIPLAGQIKPDAGLQRCRIEGDKPGRLSAAYVLHTDGIPAGYIENHKTQIRLTWKLTGGKATSLSDAERAEIDEKRRQRAAQTEARNLQNKLKAQNLYAAGKPVVSHPYLVRKNVQPHPDLRIIPVWRKRHQQPDGSWLDVAIKEPLIVPLYNPKDELSSIQVIFPEICLILGRDKDFLGQLKGVFFKIGKPTSTIIICEGLATGLTLHNSTGDQVYCAMSAVNLVNIAKYIRGLLPYARIVIAADNDSQTPGNPGVTAAKKAAQAIGGLVAIPPVAGDFNDLANAGRNEYPHK